MLSKASDPGLGGRNFDFKLVEYFAAEFKKKYKIAVRNHPKRLLRLLGEVEKLKKTMSTVTPPVPLNLECFADDKDVRSSIKRLGVLSISSGGVLPVVVFVTPGKPLLSFVVTKLAMSGTHWRALWQNPVSEVYYKK